MISYLVYIMVVGILFYTAYQFLFIGLRNSRYPEYITFGFIALLQAICSIIELYGISSNNQYTCLISRFSFFIISAVVNILFFYFISFVSGYRHSHLKWAYLSLLLLTLALNGANSFLDFINHISTTKFHLSRFGIVFVNSMFWFVNSLQYLILLLFSLKAYRFLSRKKREYSFFIIFSFLFFIVGSIDDLAINTGFTNHPIGAYFHLVLIIYVSTILFQNIERTRRFKDEAAEGEKRLRQIIDLVPNFIYAKDSDGRFILANKAVADGFKITPDRLIGQSDEDYFHIQQEIEYFRQKDLEVINSGESLFIPEETVTDSDGNLRILQTAKIPFSYMGSKAVLGVSTDITAFKKTESVLKYNELLLETIFDGASVAMVLIGENTDVLKINKAARELGMAQIENASDPKPGDILKCIVASRFEQGCGSLKECSKCILHSTIQTTFRGKTSIKKVPYTMHVNGKDNNIDYNMQISTSYLEINDSPMVLLIMEDVTAIEKVERALMESEYRYRQIIRTITDYIYTIILLDNGELQTIHSPACLSITGYEVEEFENDSSLWFKIIVDEDRDRVINFIKDRTNRTEKQSIEYRIICKDGSRRWVSNTLVEKHKKNKADQYDGIISDITERKTIEEAHNNQNKLLNTMVATLPIGVVMIKPDGSLLIVNECAKKLLGQDIFLKTDVSTISDIHRAFKADTNEPYPIEETPIMMGLKGKNSHVDDIEVELPDGTRRLLEVAACPVYDTNNNISGSLASFYDITERKNAELALRESGKMLSIMFEYSHIGISLSDYHGTIKYMNPAFCNLLNLHPDQIVDNSFHLFTGFNDGDEEFELIDKLRKGKLPILNFERKFIQEPGYEIWVQMQITCFKNNKGEVTNFIAIAEDITDRKIALDSLRASEEKFRNIFNASNDAILIVDFESNILEANQTTLSRSGYSFEQIKNLRLIDLFIAPHDHEEARIQFLNLSQNKTAFLQSNYVNQRGEKIYIEVIGHPITYNGKQLALMVSRNITERVISQQKIMNAIIEAEEKERSFFSQELHDGLGPILSTIKLYVEWIQNPDAKSDKSILLTDALSTIEEAIVSVKEISNRLSPNVLKKFGVETALRSFIKRIESLGKINFEVKINLKERIRPEIEAMLYRVFVEAINNSLKYANASNIVIQITTSQQELFALFQDDGIGFDINEISNKKSGHGLFNMQHRVEIYEGLFRLNSLPGIGTEIEMRIPSHKYVLTN